MIAQPKLRLLTVAGTRPQFVKPAAVSRAIADHDRPPLATLVEEEILHAGQHYDPMIGQVCFDEMNIPPAVVNFRVSSRDGPGEDAAAMLSGMEREIPTRKTSAAHKPYALIVAVHYRPEISGGVPRILITEDFLVRAGFRVAILTPQPIEQGCRGAEIHRLSAPAYLSVGAGNGDGSHATRPALRFCKRWMKHCAFVPDTYAYWAMRAARRAVRSYRQAPPDLVITSSPQESSHWVGWQLKKQFGCRWIADFRDGWTFEPHRAEAALPLRRWIEGCMERLVLEHADGITAATRPIAEDFQQRFPHRAEQIHFLPTGFEETAIAPQGKDDALFRLVYAGRFGLSQQTRTPGVFLDGLQLAFERSATFRRYFRLVLVGELSAEERALLTAPGLADRIELLGQQPYETALSISAGATMLLLVTPPRLRSIATRKLFDYLAVRHPIFALAEGNEAARILAETRAGLCVAPDRPAAVADGLLRVFSHWQAGRLEQEFPCSGNDLYRSEGHFSRVMGPLVQQPSTGRACNCPPTHVSQSAVGRPYGRNFSARPCASS